MYGCEEPELLNSAFREVASGEESRYGLSKRTDLLRVGVAFTAAKSAARVLSFGVVVEVVGVWPLNCADSSSYCFRSLDNWLCISELFLTYQLLFCLLLSLLCLDSRLARGEGQNSLSSTTFLLFGLRTQRFQSRAKRFQRSGYGSIVVGGKVEGNSALTFEERQFDVVG